MKAKYVKDMYRNPAYKGGKCSCCGIRPRRYQHPQYPHMCDVCRDSRVGLKDSRSPQQMEYDRQTENAFFGPGHEIPPTREYLEAKGFPSEVIEKILAKGTVEDVQTLNNPADIERQVGIFKPSAAYERFLAIRNAVKK